MDLIIAIREKYFNLIFEGTKKYEYRFVFPMVTEKMRVYLYVSKTKKAIMGYMEISESKWIDAQTAIQFYAREYSEDLNSEQVMKAWIGEHEGCFALKIDSFHQFEKPLSLEYLKEKYNFIIPQNFVYLKDPNLIHEINLLEIKKVKQFC